MDMGTATALCFLIMNVVEFSLPLHSVCIQRLFSSSLCQNVMRNFFCLLFYIRMLTHATTIITVTSVKREFYFYWFLLVVGGLCNF